MNRSNDAFCERDVDKRPRSIAELEGKEVVIFGTTVIAVNPCESAGAAGIVDSTKFGVDGFDGGIVDVGV